MLSGRSKSFLGRRPSPLSAFPLGGRCPSAHTGADEGTIQENSSLIPGMFRRPGGEFLFYEEKEPKDARGQFSRWKARLCCGGAQIRLRETAETLLGSRRGGTLGRPFVDGAARPGGRALQKESVPERRRGQAPALQRWKHSKLGISFQGGRPHGAAHTEENKLGALARQSQAQKMNRNGGNFCKLRAQWPGMKR